MIRIQLYGGRHDGTFANIASGEAPPDSYKITDGNIEHHYILFTYLDANEIPRFEYRYKEAQIVDKS